MQPDGFEPRDTDQTTGPFVIGKLARVLADRRLRQAEQSQAESAASTVVDRVQGLRSLFLPSSNRMGYFDRGKSSSGI